MGTMMVTATLDAGHLWRERLAGTGLRVAFGSPLPPGRRLRVLVRGGAVVADADESARWRGRLLVRERPAACSAEDRQQIHAAALAFAPPSAEVELELAWDGGGEPVLIGATLAFDAASWAPITGTCLEVTLSAIAPYRGPLTDLALPAGATTTLVHGAPVQCAAGDRLAAWTISAPTRAAALAELAIQVRACRFGGPLSDAERLLAALPRISAGLTSARALDDLSPAPCAVEVLHPGLLTTVQAWPGRLGRWDVGVPPSGPFDDLSFRFANRLVGNHESAAGLEMTLLGPQLRFHQDAVVCLSGAPRQALLTVPGAAPVAVPLWTAVAVPAGALLATGVAAGPGCRGYLAVRHGLAVAEYLGSSATFDLGGFGGFAGRALAAGDLVPLTRPAPAVELAACPPRLAPAARPVCSRTWSIGVLIGPHAAPEFLTPDDVAMLFSAAWTVHHNSSRTGIRLLGPKPVWARRDGGEAGLHPSNIHDNAYAVGAIDFTGDMPILLGPDGPSCGGFVCPAVVVSAERWKLGQLRPGDTVRFAPLSAAAADELRRQQDALLAAVRTGTVQRLVGSSIRKGASSVAAVTVTAPPAPPAGAVIARIDDWCLRRAGDDYLLVEVGDAVLDLGLRLRIQLLQQQLVALRLPGIVDLTPGIRSLQLHLEPRVLAIPAAVEAVLGALRSLPSIEAVAVPRRTVWLPLAWDDPDTRKAIAIYTRSVNPTAPWCPSNIEFIRRINGLESIDEVQRIVYAAEYLVMGLGDVYLGAPVATPLDPRHRLVTTKYNPARTWTPQNAVGIGGAYMCIYGMEGPGGYQFVGRTVPVWDTWGAEPCLLRNFDVIRFFPVEHAELLELRAKPYQPRIEEGVFRWAEYQRFLAEHADSIAAFRTTQRAAFQEERQRWASGVAAPHTDFTQADKVSAS